VGDGAGGGTAYSEVGNAAAESFGAALPLRDTASSPTAAAAPATGSVVADQNRYLIA
jgi:hypothetical protein